MDTRELQRRIQLAVESQQLTEQDISDMTGIPIDMIGRVVRGKEDSPAYDLLLAMEDAVHRRTLNNKKPNRETLQLDRDLEHAYPISLDAPMMIRETGSYAYRSRVYTEEDLGQLPENVRAELLGGILYFKGMPSLTHERIISRVARRIEDYIGKNSGLCEVFAGHYAMRLYEEGKETHVVLPDIMVICNPDLLGEELCDGAADWVIEVVSPGNAAYDYQDKVYYYRRGGVRVYWIIDSMKRMVTVFDYESEYSGVDGHRNKEGITIYSFEEKIPVSIYKGFELCLTDMGF